MSGIKVVSSVFVISTSLATCTSVVTYRTSASYNAKRLPCLDWTASSCKLHYKLTPGQTWLRDYIG